MNAMRVAVARATVRAPLAAFQMRAASEKVVKKAAPAKEVSAKKAAVEKARAAAKKAQAAEKANKAAAEKAAHKKKVAKEAALAKKAILAAKAKGAALSKRAALAKKKAALQAKEAKLAARKEKLRKLSALTNPFNLFVNKTTSGADDVTIMKDVSAKWKALPDAEKAVFRAQAKKKAAAKDLIKDLIIQISSNKPLPKYTRFVKANFPAAYAAARKTTTDNETAFVQAMTKIAANYYKVSK